MTEMTANVILLTGFISIPYPSTHLPSS